MHEFMPEFMKLLFDAVYWKNRGTTLSFLCCVTYDMYNFTYMTWHPEVTHLKPKFNIFNSIHRYYLWQVKQSYGSISINWPPPIWQSLILASLVLHVTPVARSRIKMASKLSLLPFGCLPVNWAKGCSDLADKRNATCARVSLSHPKMLWNTPLGFEMVVGSWLNGQLVYNDHFFCFHHRN